jgi:hypothetical protein
MKINIFVCAKTTGPGIFPSCQSFRNLIYNIAKCHFMNNFCIHCGAAISNQVADTCPVCHAELPQSPQSPAVEQSLFEKQREMLQVPAKGLKGTTFAYIGIIFAVASVVVLPVLFGPLALGFGYIATKRGERGLGLVAMILGVVLALIGAIFGFLFASMIY